MNLDHYRDNPNTELPFDAVEAIGLDGTGITADERFPYTWSNLTDGERAKLREVAHEVPE